MELSYNKEDNIPTTYHVLAVYISSIRNGFHLVDAIICGTK